MSDDAILEARKIAEDHIGRIIPDPEKYPVGPRNIDIFLSLVLPNLLLDYENKYFLRYRNLLVFFEYFTHPKVKDMILNKLQISITNLNKYYLATKQLEEYACDEVSIYVLINDHVESISSLFHQKQISLFSEDDYMWVQSKLSEIDILMLRTSYQHHFTKSIEIFNTSLHK